MGRALSLGPRCPPQALAAELRRSLDAPHRGGPGDDADQARPHGHPGPAAPAAAARAPGVDLGQPERRARDLWRRAGWPDRGRVRQLRRADQPEAARRAIGRGPAPPGPLLVRPVGDARGSPLLRSGRDPAAQAGATPARPGLDRRVLAPSRTDATRCPMGRRGSLVRVRRARPPTARRRSARPGRVRRCSSRGRRAPAIRGCSRRSQPDQRRRCARPARSTGRGRSDLAGRASAPRRRDRTAGAGTASHRGRSTRPSRPLSRH